MESTTSQIVKFPTSSGFSHAASHFICQGFRTQPHILVKLTATSATSKQQFTTSLLGKRCLECATYADNLLSFLRLSCAGGPCEHPGPAERLLAGPVRGLVRQQQEQHRADGQDRRPGRWPDGSSTTRRPRPFTLEVSPLS